MKESHAILILVVPSKKKFFFFCLDYIIAPRVCVDLLLIDRDSFVSEIILGHLNVLDPTIDKWFWEKKGRGQSRKGGEREGEGNGVRR